jgi:hypothetical protein
LRVGVREGDRTLRPRRIVLRLRTVGVEGVAAPTLGLDLNDHVAVADRLPGSVCGCSGLGPAITHEPQHRTIRGCTEVAKILVMALSGAVLDVRHS